MNTEKIMRVRLEAMDLDIKQIFELLLSVHTEREFLSRMLLMKESERKSKKRIKYKNF